TVNTTSFTVKDSSNNNAIAGTVSLSPDGKTATFTPSSNLSSFTTYTATITTGVKDLAGNAMTANYVWTFTTQAVNPYHYQPFLSFSGSNFTDIASSPSLQLGQFSVAAWFQTSKSYASDAYIVNKGGAGSELPGKNMNYGIWVLSGSNKIQAGFENSTGTNLFVTSPSAYNDGKWHYAVATYDGSVVRLYIDGLLVSSLSTTLIPDNTGTQPLRIGANSLSLNNYFTGNADEIRVWNRAITASEVTDGYVNGNFNTNGQVVYVFGPPDRTPPSVSSTMPANGATGVAINSPITATFSEAVQSSTINTNTFTLKDSSNNAIAGTVSLSPDGKTATFTPSSNLALPATYTATISTGVKDLAGNAMAANYVWTFTTIVQNTRPQTVPSTSSSTVA